MKLQLNAIAALITLTVTSVSHAHVSFLANPANNAYANKTYLATLQVPHGCSNSAGEHFDTTQVTVTIPPGFTGVKPADAVFGTASVEKNAAGEVTSITWTKTTPNSDDFLYTPLQFRGKPAADSTWTALDFVTTQTCSGGGDPVVWEGADVPKLKVYASRTPGWNKFTAQALLDETTIKAFFTDAEIVWFGDAAYSVNPDIMGLITTALKQIPAGGEFWVKY